MFLKRFYILMAIFSCLTISACSSEENNIINQWQEELKNSENTESVNFISSIFNDQTYNDLSTMLDMSEQIAERISRDKGITQQTVAQILETGGYGAEAALKIARNLVNDFSTITGIKQSDIILLLLQEEMSSSIDGILHIPNNYINQLRIYIDEFGVGTIKQALENINKNKENDLDDKEDLIIDKSTGFSNREGL